MTNNIQQAMKADYLKVLTENKKMRQELANLKKEIAHLKGMIPKDEDIDLAIGGTTGE
jgi:cell division septum initiation protein DivIVA